MAAPWPHLAWLLWLLVSGAGAAPSFTHLISTGPVYIGQSQPLTNCDGQGTLVCPTGTCYTGANGYIGCCSTTSCIARTQCFAFTDPRAFSCDINYGGCIGCQDSYYPACVLFTNTLEHQYAVSCGTTGTTSVVGYANLVTSGNPAGTPTASGLSVGSSASATATSTSAETSPAGTSSAPSSGNTKASSTTGNSSSSSGGGGGLNAQDEAAIVGGSLGAVLLVAAVAVCCLRLEWHWRFIAWLVARATGAAVPANQTSNHSDTGATAAPHANEKPVSHRGQGGTAAVPGGPTPERTTADTAATERGAREQHGAEGGEGDPSPLLNKKAPQKKPSLRVSAEMGLDEAPIPQLPTRHDLPRHASDPLLLGRMSPLTRLAIAHGERPRAPYLLSNLPWSPDTLSSLASDSSAATTVGGRYSASGGTAGMPGGVSDDSLRHRPPAEYRDSAGYQSIGSPVSTASPTTARHLSALSAGHASLMSAPSTLHEHRRGHYRSTSAPDRWQNKGQEQGQGPQPSPMELGAIPPGPSPCIPADIPLPPSPAPPAGTFGRQDNGDGSALTARGSAAYVTPEDALRFGL